MKKFISVALMTLFCATLSAQEESIEPERNNDIKVSINFGSTVGDDVSRDSYKTNLGFDFSYYHNVTSDLKLGGVAGMKHIYKDESSNNQSDAGFVSFGAGARLYTTNDRFWIGGDAGYAYGFDEGGFYYRPMLGIEFTEHSGVYVSYTELDDNGKFSTVNIGYEFSF